MNVTIDALNAAMEEAGAHAGTMPGIMGKLFQEVAKIAIETYCKELDEPRMGSSGEYDPRTSPLAGPLTPSPDEVG